MKRQYIPGEFVLSPRGVQNPLSAQVKLLAHELIMEG